MGIEASAFADFHFALLYCSVLWYSGMPMPLSKSVEVNYNDFKSFVDSVMDTCIPTKRTSSRFNMPWFNNTLKRMCRKKQRLFNKAKRTKSAQHWEQ